MRSLKCALSSAYVSVAVYSAQASTVGVTYDRAQCVRIRFYRLDRDSLPSPFWAGPYVHWPTRQMAKQMSTGLWGSSAINTK